MARLSIIVPVYQVKPYLERCLNSILSQTFTDYEVILVDDGSTDGSQDICDLYADQYEKITVIHKPNGGLSSARNAGIEAASAEYIMFVDSDDLIHVRTAELEMKFLQEQNADVLLCSLAKFRNSEDIDIHSVIEKLEGVKVISGTEASKGFFDNPHANKYVSSCGKIFKRSLFNDVRFPEGRLFEDEFTTYRLYYKCDQIVLTDSELYYYYVNPTGITQNLDLNKRFDEYDAQIERINFYKKKNDVDLFHMALLEFLRSAQWDLIKVNEGKQVFDHDRGLNFQSQYSNSLKQAEKEKIVSFMDNYDYFVLAYPEKKTFFRLKRLLLKLVGKM